MSLNFWSKLLFVMCLGGSTEAHPHVFVDARTGFIFDADGQLEALRILWTYDEFTTLILLESLNLDQDGDGKFNDADRLAVVEGETNWDPEYKGDVYLEVAGQDYPLGRPEAAAVTFENNRVEVSFELPLSQPVMVSGTPALLRLYDPIFFYAYTILPEVRPDSLPEGCQAQIVSFEPDAVTSAIQQKLAALRREEAPSQENVGRLFSDEVHLTCG
ncbi:DUF1007 family protein [Pseudopelagicola sp. nBUS_20]|uniref:DUF1007 family protein n=1 Tax=Pseudopelagicola sp. nBUS_20 TaxID=3395317 RepID=UPI003EBBA378